jgi:hypothetical protein
LLRGGFAAKQVDVKHGRREAHATGPPSPRWGGAMAGSLRQDPGLPAGALAKAGGGEGS